MRIAVVLGADLLAKRLRRHAVFDLVTKELSRGVCTANSLEPGSRSLLSTVQSDDRMRRA